MTQRRPDFIPKGEGAFTAWLGNFYPGMADWWNTEGLDEDVLDRLTALYNEFTAAQSAHGAAAAALAEAYQTKLAAREALTAQIRSMVRITQASLDTNNAARALMGITVRKSGRSPAPAVTTRPQATATITGKLTHRLRLTDESTPLSRAKPQGILGAEVYVATVAPDAPLPSSPDAYRFLTLATNTPQDLTFPTEAGGKTAAYLIRWRNTRGEVGPWSEIATATIAA